MPGQGGILPGMTAHPAAGNRHHGNRHGRSESARIAVLRAVDDLLAERGLAGMTVEGIAAAACVAKQTIYRRWDSITDILFEALAEYVAAHFTSPDTGDLGTDLRTRLRETAAFLARRDTGAMVRALAGQAQHDQAIAARFEAQYLAGQRDLDRQPFLRAIQCGALPPATDIDLAVDQLACRSTTARCSAASRSRPTTQTSWSTASWPARLAHDPRGSVRKGVRPARRDWMPRFRGP